MPVGFLDPNVIGRDDVASFIGVARLPAHARSECRRDGGGAGRSFDTRVLPDPLAQAVFHPDEDDFARAGKAFVDKPAEERRGRVVQCAGPDTRARPRLLGRFYSLSRWRRAKLA